MRTILTTTTTSLALTATSTQRSTWHSPVPYLFGGLAAMLGLIAFALLILACSYWKLSGQLQNEDSGDRDLESGAEREGDSTNKESVKVYEEKILVIMAGDDKPTFLATPACANCSSLCNGVENDSDKDIQNHEETCERLDKNMDNHVQATTTTSQPQSPETQQQQSQQE